MPSYTIAVCCGALFRLKVGDTDYCVGAAFPFVKALNMVNQQLDKLDQAIEERFNIVLITTHQDNIQLKAIIEHNNLYIDQICEITAERSLQDHLNILKPVLYLSTDSDSVRQAIKAGFGAATMFQRDYPELSDGMLRVAFDGDGVLFSDESERVYAEKGLAGFQQNEKEFIDQPLALGPLREFAEALVALQKSFERAQCEMCPIRFYLVTSRNRTAPAIRALKSLQIHGLDTDEAPLSRWYSERAGAGNNPASNLL